MGVCILGARGVGGGGGGGRQLREWKLIVLVFTQHGVAVCSKSNIHLVTQRCLWAAQSVCRN